MHLKTLQVALFVLLYHGMPAETSSEHKSRDEHAQHSVKPNAAADAVRRIVIVGGGLAGVSAALEAHRHAGEGGNSIEIVLIEKTPRLGGNSAKASSGINALNLPGGDSVELFEKDTLVSGGGLSDVKLVETLVTQSPEAMEFLSGMGLSLSKITQLGGHSVPRSHSNPVGPNVGLAIMQALGRKAQQLPEVRIMEGNKLEGIIMEGGRVSGVKISSTNDNTQSTLRCDALILATGGFAANKTMLQVHNPTAAGLATTNGDWAQGDALSIAEGAGAKLVHLEHVQIHPTGFLDPKDPDSGTKWLCPEKFRGVGSVLINSEGRRFVNELATRDVVSTAMLKQSGQRAFLLLDQEAAEDFGIKTVEFYCSRGLMNKVAGVPELAQHMSVDEAVLSEEIAAYNVAVAAGKDAFGKKVFKASIHTDTPLYVGVVVPVVHYTMGGVLINSEAQALSAQNEQPIPGLYAAGEVSGGVHGVNRLGGNSLLECAVFGRIAGKAAVEYVLEETSRPAL
mmetsp:Transcript_14460/g.31345  ORF Transcript_14460/g.31345 Transcript_14460/m.31345 type:complete len:509 (-) Transcript_14460:702-2228(-)